MVFCGDFTVSTQDDVMVLSKYTEVHGDLIIADTKNFVGIERSLPLTIIRGDLYISYNDALVSLAGFDNLSTVEGSLIIFENPLLTTLKGLEGIEVVMKDLFIMRNDSLISVDGLRDLILVNDDIRVLGNINLLNPKLNKKLVCWGEKTVEAGVDVSAILASKPEESDIPEMEWRVCLDALVDSEGN